MARALAAPPALVLVEGEAGIGKSRLVAEFLRSPAVTGRSALLAACPPFRQPLTLSPFVDAIRQATDDVTGLHLNALAGALRPLFPEFASDLPPAPEPLEDATAARHRLFRALAELLGRLQVTILAVEDAHWADEASLEFLLFLTTRQPQPMSLIVTYRPEDVPDGSLLRRLSSRQSASARSLRLTLSPLDVADTARLVSSMLDDGPVSAAFAALLHQGTEGLPLAVEESVRLLRDRRDLRRRGGEWVRRYLGDLDVAPTVRDAVLERTGRLEGNARAVLQAGAVLAAPASEHALAAVAGLPAARIRAGLAAALGCGLLAEDNQGQVSFRHMLAARAIYDTIPVPQRREMHLRAGHMLMGISPLPVAQLARHFCEARESEEWCRYAEQAADLALASGDQATAAVLLHDLLAHADLPATAVVRLMQKIPLYTLARSAFLDDLTHRLRSVIDDADLSPAQRAEVGCQLGRILLHTGEFQAGAAELERAIPELGHRPVEAAHAMIWLGTPSQTLRPVSTHRRWLDRAAATMANPSILASDRLELSASRVSALLELGEQAGWAEAARLPQTPATERETLPLARGYLNIGEAAMYWGRYRESRQRLTTALQLAAGHDYPRLRDRALAMLVHLDWFTGAWAGLPERAVAAGRDDVSLLVRLEAMLVAGLLDAAAGGLQTAEQQLGLVLEEEMGRGIVTLPLEPAAALARLRLAAGATAEALTLTDEPVRIITAKGVWLWATDIAPVRVQALAAVGHGGEAAKLVDAFARGLRVRGRNAPAPQAALVLCRAILAESQGETARAAALYARAAAAWAALPRPYDALLARERQGCCLLAVGQADTGLAVLRDIFQDLSSLGAGGDAERVVRVLRSRGVHVPRLWRHGRRGYGSQLSPREIEVVQLLVAGCTTRQIARELCRSPNTVDMHLKSAMRKLNVPSRAALAARVVEVGLAAGARPPENGAASTVKPSR